MDSDSSSIRFHQGLLRDALSWSEREGCEVHLRTNFTLVMLDMLRLSRETGVWPERDVIKYIRSAIAIDGLITRFAPTFDVGNHLRTTCDRYLKLNLRRRLFSMINLIGWTAATGQLIRDGGVRALEALGRQGDVRTSHFQSSSFSDPVTGLTTSKILYLGAFVFALCLAASQSSHAIRYGANLFTAEVTLAGIALTWMIQSLGKTVQR